MLTIFPSFAFVQVNDKKSFLLNSLRVGVHRSRSPAHSAARERGESIRGRDQSRPRPRTGRTKHVGAELNEQCQSASLCSVLKWAFKDDGRKGGRESQRGGVAIGSPVVPFSLKDRRTAHAQTIHPSTRPSLIPLFNASNGENLAQLEGTLHLAQGQ